MQLSEKGQSTMQALLGVPVLLIGLYVVFQILTPVTEVLINHLDTVNSAIVSNVSAIKILVALIGFIVLASVLMNMVQSFRQPPGFGQQGF